MRKLADAHALAGFGVNALRGNGELAVDDYKRHLGEVAVRILEVLGLKLHVIGTDVGRTHRVVARELEVGILIQLVGSAEVVAAHRLLGPIVFEGSGVLGDGNDDLRIVLGYDQLAELVRNQVVAFARTLIERVRELVVALADIRLRASDVAKSRPRHRGSQRPRQAEWR